MHSETLSRYLALKEQGHLIHARDIAAEMGISEAELVHCRTGYDACRLTPDIPAIFRNYFIKVRIFNFARTTKH